MIIKVDVIIAVHDAESTIEETVHSAMHQIVPEHLINRRCDAKSSQSWETFEQKIQSPPIYFSTIQFDILVCCFDDASNDTSLDILHRLETNYSTILTTTHQASTSTNNATVLPTKLVTGTSLNKSTSRGAGYARNQAVKLRETYEQSHKQSPPPFQHFLCILDSDDIMSPTRIAEQTYAMLTLGYDKNGRHLCETSILGCQFDRIPKDSTWHYQTWANSLSDERLYLEAFRECTVLQPTWFLHKAWFEHLGGYLEAPDQTDEQMDCYLNVNYALTDCRGRKRKIDKTYLSTEGCQKNTAFYRLIHPSELDQYNENKETESNTLRLAEDLRFFYAHLHSGGLLHLHRTPSPMVSYRHRLGISQSSSTSRKLLLRLRAKAWEDLVYYGRGCSRTHGYLTVWSKWGFAIWGAGRDGKDFLKALSPQVASSVVCFVDVDPKKIEKIKWYSIPGSCKRIPIFHFSILRKPADEACNNMALNRIFPGRIDKKQCANAFSVVHQRHEMHTVDSIHPGKGKELSSDIQIDFTKFSPLDKVSNSTDILANLPVVVCVSMYRTSGALEENVSSIGRKEGNDLWHIV